MGIIVKSDSRAHEYHGNPNDAKEVREAILAFLLDHLSVVVNEAEDDEVSAYFYLPEVFGRDGGLLL